MGLVEEQATPAGNRPGDGQAFHGVVVLGGGAVQVQVTDLLGLQPGTGQRLRIACSLLPVGSGAEVVARIAPAPLPNMGRSGRFATHQEQHRRFADIDAVAVH